MHTSKQTFEKHIDLLLLSSSKSFHYVLIKDFNIFMTIKQNITGKNIFVDNADSTILAQEY